jgi:GDP-L-fucose synthase
MDAVDSGASEIICWGDGSPTREFLYVDDCADAIIAATQRYEKAGPINIGSGQEISIRCLADKIAAFTGFRGQILWNTSQPNGQPRRCLDVDRAQREFGFRARTGFDEGLMRTIDWYRYSLLRQPTRSELHDVSHSSAGA